MVKEKKKSKNVFVALQSTESKYRYYLLKNNAKVNNKKLEFNKYDPHVKKTVKFVEIKIKKGK